VNVDLRGGETEAARGVHGLKHVLNELMEFGSVEFGLGHRGSGAFEVRVVEVTDHFVGHQNCLTCSM
jgi:hypothetical protein